MQAIGSERKVDRKILFLRKVSKRSSINAAFAISSSLRYNLCMDFQLVTNYKPKGDQPRAIEELMDGLAAGEKHQVLLGVTGLRQDLHHGQDHRGVEPAGADTGAQ